LKYFYEINLINFPTFFDYSIEMIFMSSNKDNNDEKISEDVWFVISNQILNNFTLTSVSVCPIEQTRYHNYYIIIVL
jgi:hypothetical protein